MTLKQLKKQHIDLPVAELRHRLTYKKRNSRMLAAMVRFEKCDTKKPKKQIKEEVNLCRKFWRCYPLHYYRHNLYRKDKKLSEKELINYIPEFFFYHVFLGYYTSRDYEILSRDKNIAELIFRTLSIAQVPTLAKLVQGSLYSREFTEISYDKLMEKINEYNCRKIFIKPAKGQGGYGIFVFQRNNSRRYVDEDTNIFDEEFFNEISMQNDYILQPGIEQDDENSKIYPHSVNTFRIVTENKDGNLKVLCATLRIGRNGKQVDNGTQGGFKLKIDVDTGAAAEHAIAEYHKVFEKHHDTGYIFKTHKVSRWKAIKEFVVESAKKMPQFTYLAWDIALTKSGPLVIEVNQNFGLDHYQATWGGLRKLFEIDNPQFYWDKKFAGRY